MVSPPESMIAIEIRQAGGPEMLVPAKRVVPLPNPGEILIRVSTAGVNRPDVLQRSGAYPAPKGASDIPGLEVSGHVAAVGAEVARWTRGDAVCALTPGGGYAEYAVVHGSNALPIPVGLDMDAAGGIPETFFTVWHNLFERGRLKRGETLLVHGGASGIGTTAIMLAKAFGAKVLATAGSAQKCEACRRLGADLAIDYNTDDWVAAVKTATYGHGPNLILDIVGGPYIAKNYAVAAHDARIVSIGFLQGSKVEVDFMRIMLKRLTHTGSTLRSQSVEVKARIARDLEQNVWPLLATGSCRPVIHSRFPLVEASKAHALMESNQHIGKIVLFTDYS